MESKGHGLNHLERNFTSSTSFTSNFWFTLAAPIPAKKWKICSISMEVEETVGNNFASCRQGMTPERHLQSISFVWFRGGFWREICSSSNRGATV